MYVYTRRSGASRDRARTAEICMTRALALVSSAAFLLWSHAASAKPKVALTQIEGDASGDVRDAVAEALEGKELALIGSKEVNRAVDKLGDLADLTEKDLKKL